MFFLKPVKATELRFAKFETNLCRTWNSNTKKEQRYHVVRMGTFGGGKFGGLGQWAGAWIGAWVVHG